MFRTALPFGYLVQFLALVGCAGLAAVLLLRGWRRHDRRALRRGAGVLAGLAAVLALAAAQRSVEEWNPYPIPAGALLGRWADGPRSLELRADSTYVWRDGATAAAEGRYHLFDWNLTLAGAPAGAAGGWRVVEAGGEYRIMRNPEEADVWDGHLGFRRRPPARVP